MFVFVGVDGVVDNIENLPLDMFAETVRSAITL